MLMPAASYAAAHVPDVGYSTRCWHAKESLAALHTSLRAALLCTRRRGNRRRQRQWIWYRRRLTRDVGVGVVWEWAQREARETLVLLQSLPGDVHAELMDAVLE